MEHDTKVTMPNVKHHGHRPMRSAVVELVVEILLGCTGVLSVIPT